MKLKGIPELPSTEITRMKDRIAAFDDSDRSRRLREEALNQLEGFTYKARDFLDNEDFVAASTETERSDLEAKAKAASEWIYSGGADASREELKARLKEMKDIVTPIQKRKEENAGRPAQLKELNEALEQTKSFIAGIKEQIKNDTAAHSSFSASKSSSASATPSSTATVDDFADLEDDEEATATATAPLEEETLPPPVYSEADLVKPQELYDSISKWLAELLEQQEKLGPTSDPVLLVKDMAERAKQLQDIGIELIMKSMKQPYKTARKPTSSGKAKKGAKKTGGKKKAKTASASAEPSNPTFKVGENDEMPSEEQILEAIKRAKDNSEKGEKEDIKHSEL